MKNNSETTNSELSVEFNNWADKLEQMDDISISREIFNRIYYTDNDLSKFDKAILKDAYEYCIKMINQNKSLELELLKIYLEDVKGHEKISELNIYMLISLLGCCGIIFEK